MPGRSGTSRDVSSVLPGSGPRARLLHDRSCRRAWWVPHSHLCAPGCRGPVPQLDTPTGLWGTEGSGDACPTPTPGAELCPGTTAGQDPSLCGFGAAGGPGLLPSSRCFWGRCVGGSPPRQVSGCPAAHRIRPCPPQPQHLGPAPPRVTLKERWNPWISDFFCTILLRGGAAGGGVAGTKRGDE